MKRSSESQPRHAAHTPALKILSSFFVGDLFYSDEPPVWYGAPAEDDTAELPSLLPLSPAGRTEASAGAYAHHGSEISALPRMTPEVMRMIENAATEQEIRNVTGVHNLFDAQDPRKIYDSRLPDLKPIPETNEVARSSEPIQSVAEQLAPNAERASRFGKLIEEFNVNYGDKL